MNNTGEVPRSPLTFDNPIQSPSAGGSSLAAGITFETAAEHATPNVPVVSRGARMAGVRQSLAGRRFESATHIVVCDGGRFVEMLRIEDVLAAPDDLTVAEAMDTAPPVVTPGVDQEVAAWRAVQHGESALAVVDHDGSFVGIIPPDRLLAVLLSEHEEDLSRLGGFLKSSSRARQSSEEPVRRRFWHRVPWLLIGLAGAFLAADFVGWFESKLREKLILAFFLPGIIYLADAVGTQTETVIVRGLSVGLRLRQMVRCELLTGLAMGITLAAVSFPIILWRWGDRDVAIGVSLSLAAACSTGTIAAMLLPWLLDRAGFDPAFGSGPLATVLQDLLSILIYFAVISAVLR